MGFSIVLFQDESYTKRVKYIHNDIHNGNMYPVHVYMYTEICISALRITNKSSPYQSNDTKMYSKYTIHCFQHKGRRGSVCSVSDS